MHYTSTRNNQIRVTAAQAIASGISAEGGLYVPMAFPTITAEDLQKWVSLDYKGRATAILSRFLTDFTEEEIGTEEFYEFSELDQLGRAGCAWGCIGPSMLATEERGSIGMIRPSGWHTVKYDFVDGLYLYNRCHLIAFSLCGVNADERNLITGTRYMNTEGMLPFENMVADYIKETGNHVLYRVTPIYEGNDLVARGVQMEAYSVEDNGQGFLVNAGIDEDGVTLGNYSGKMAELGFNVLDAAGNLRDMG